MRDRSRFFRSKTKEKFKKPSPATPWPAHFFLMEFLYPFSARIRLPLSTTRSSPGSRSLLALSSSPSLDSLPPLSLSPAPPSARPLPPSQLPRRGSRARAPLLRPGLDARAPRRPAARGAGARRSSYTLQRRQRQRRWWRRGALAERRAQPPALPQTDPLPGPERERFLPLWRKPQEASFPRDAPHPPPAG